MARKDETARYTADELEAKRRHGQSRTNWAEVDAMREQESEASIAADADDVHQEPDWGKAVRGLPPPQDRASIRIDADILAWFRRTGRDYQMRINSVLRAFIESRK